VQVFTVANSQPARSEKTLLNDKVAVIGGILVTVCIAVWTLMFCLQNLPSLMTELFWLTAIGYLVGMLVVFWSDRSYRDGVSANKARKLGLWPFGVAKALVFGLLQECNATGLEPKPHVFDGSKVLIAKKGTRQIGIALTALASVAAVIYLIVVGSGLVTLWLLFLGIYGLGCVTYFWVTKLYLGGLTISRLLVIILWPIEVARIGKAGAKLVLAKNK
jgi:hypothetical protein